MPLYELGPDELIPFRRVRGGPNLYEEEVEGLLWANLDAFIGRPLFPVARQPTVGDGLRPDILALDTEGRVHVIEVKRDVDRRQLAQCLEYAGWAQTTNLDELAGLFHGGTDQFFSAWMEFTESPSPRLVQLPPQLVLVAYDFDDRTEAALSFMTDNDLPVTVLRVAIYEDQEGRRFIDVGTDFEPELPEVVSAVGPSHYKLDGRRVTIGDLVDAGLLRTHDTLVWERPRLGDVYQATVAENATIRLDDGRAFSSPSRAAIEAAGIPAYDGWIAWRTETGVTLAQLRDQLMTNAGSD